MGSSRNILIVDDDPRASSYLADLIRYIGFDTECVENCRDAKRRLQQDSFDSLLLCQWLDDGSADSILDWLRQQGRTEPVIVISPAADYDLWIELVNKGAADLLPKPVQTGQLEHALKLAMGDRYFTESQWQTTIVT